MDISRVSLGLGLPSRILYWLKYHLQPTLLATIPFTCTLYHMIPLKRAVLAGCILFLQVRYPNLFVRVL